ncbi:MAG: TIGR01244 family sulfur transferase [Rhodospirillaceae bacterium]
MSASDAVSPLPSGAEIRTLSPDLAVSGQISVADPAALALAGFRSVIACRPDHEDPGQPEASEIGAAVEQAGLTFAHLPVISGGTTEDDIATFQTMMAQLPRPIFAYCRTGTRIAKMWAQGQAVIQSIDGLIAAAGQAGYNLEPLRADLKARAAASAKVSAVPQARSA